MKDRDPEEAGSGRRATPPWLRLATELGPLVLFFVVNARADIYVATGTLMVALVVAVAVAWYFERRVPVMPMVTMVFALVLGGLTLWLKDDVFIKLKPTIVNALLATTLFVGLATGRSLLEPVMGTAVAMDAEGWRKLTFRFACFFVVLALLNELVWRNVSTDAWVTFKVWGIMPLTFAFAMLQAGLMQRHQLTAEAADETSSGSPGASDSGDV